LTTDINIIIKAGTVKEVLLLQQVSIVTFIDTYATYNTPENMQLYIDTYFNYDRLWNELNDTAIQYFLAFINDEIVGYIKLRTVDEPVELEGKKHIEIERIYVLPEHKGRQIGKKLISHAVGIATQQQYQVIWLGVWEENKNAITFYTKQGFAIFGEHSFVLGTEPQRDWLMKKELKAVGA